MRTHGSGTSFVLLKWHLSIPCCHRRVVHVHPRCPAPHSRSRVLSCSRRVEPGVQTPEESLSKASGSCRDSACMAKTTSPGRLAAHSGGLARRSAESGCHRPCAGIGNRQRAQQPPLPRLFAVFGPLAKTEHFFNTGHDFHSNDAFCCQGALVRLGKYKQRQ